MTGFMIYMSGTNISIFPIMMTYMAISTAIKQILNVNKAFEPVKDGNGLLGYKLLYILFSFIGLCIGMYYNIYI